MFCTSGLTPFHRQVGEQSVTSNDDVTGKRAPWTCRYKNLNFLFVAASHVSHGYARLRYIVPRGMRTRLADPLLL